ncbi:unnamed protein product [Strongylus vulgaris]|uniref:Uncharacterized protein n=1 Tax=Strongylus vulgaris TaxID=40348 RepID=A0A3P7KAA2_STRVU|nr:unnamed protein product [Strongylus vulgaris]
MEGGVVTMGCTRLLIGQRSWRKQCLVRMAGGHRLSIAHLGSLALSQLESFGHRQVLATAGLLLCLLASGYRNPTRVSSQQKKTFVPPMKSVRKRLMGPINRVPTKVRSSNRPDSSRLLPQY